MKASAQQRPPKRVPFLRSPAVKSPSRDDDSQLCGGQQPFFCSEEQKGEEAATPRQPVAQARFWKFPPGNSLRESPVSASSAAITRPSQELSRFAALTLCHFAPSRNTKNVRDCAETVDVETSLWKLEEI